MTVGDQIPDSTTILVDGRPPDSALSFVRSVVVPFAGIPEVTRLRMLAHPSVQLYNLHFNCRATGELAVALLLAAARRVVSADSRLRTGQWAWRTEDDPGISLYGKTATIYGYGEVGKVVGQALEGLGMTVIGVRRSGGVSLDEALSNSHALVVTAPLTDETQGAITSQRLRLLKEPRLVCNVGRGPIIDELALYEACRSGEVAAAGIDVWYRYPSEEEPNILPSALPFHDLENVVLSPHRAGSTSTIESERIIAIAEVIKAICSDEPPKPVDVTQGY